MEVIKEGHSYRLDNFEESSHQVLEFIEKRPAEDGAKGEMEIVQAGTTNEEVLDMMIDRMEHLQEKMPCTENELALAGLVQARAWLKIRTKDREERGVEGTHEE